MCQFVDKGNEESIGIQVMIHRNAVMRVIDGRTVIAKFGFAATCDFQMNFMLNNPFGNLVDSPFREVLPEYGFVIFIHPGKDRILELNGFSNS
jgi:hypothetical protein